MAEDLKEANDQTRQHKLENELIVKELGMKDQANTELREKIHQMKKVDEEQKKEQKMEIESLEYQNRVMAEENDDLIGRVAKTRMTPKHRIKALLIVDSNGQRIKQDLELQQDIEWTVTTNTYTHEMAQDYIRRPNNEINQNDAMGILIGTNHIKKGEQADDDFDKMRKTAAMIKSKPIIILENPPIRDERTHNNETKIFNSILHNNREQLPKNTNICYYRNHIFKIPLNKAMEDNLHLQRGPTTEIVAEELRKTIIKATKHQSTKGQETKGDETTRKLEVPSDKAGLVIGNKAANLRKWQDQHNVTITKNSDRNKPEFTITGNRDSVTESIKAMRAIFSTEERQTNRRERAQTKIQCRFYIQGKCRNGTNCDYSHDPTPTPGHRVRSRSPRK